MAPLQPGGANFQRRDGAIERRLGDGPGPLQAFAQAHIGGVGIDHARDGSGISLAVQMRLGYRDQEPAGIRPDIDRAEDGNAIAARTRSLPSPPAAVIGMAFLPGALRGQHRLLPFGELGPEEQLRATRLMEPMTNRP